MVEVEDEKNVKERSECSNNVLFSFNGKMKLWRNGRKNTERSEK